MKVELHFYRGVTNHSSSIVNLKKMEIEHIPKKYYEFAQLIEYDPLTSPYGHNYNMALKGVDEETIYYINASFWKKQGILLMYHKHWIQNNKSGIIFSLFGAVLTVIFSGC